MNSDYLDDRCSRPALDVLRHDARVAILRSLAANRIVRLPDALSDAVTRVVAEMVVAGECDLADDGSEVYPTLAGRIAYLKSI